ncbi:MAG TPA: ABC transporter permease [Streptosporangiaceae bacterium]|nr:ABC transporter permease [Streptosporangiaceae bacterium]
MSAVALGGERTAWGGPHLLAGTRELAGLALRRDRIFLVIWLYALVGTMAATTYDYRHLFVSAAQRASLAHSIQTNPSFVTLSGPVYGDSLGALIIWKAGLFVAVGAALLGIFAVIRHTRADEEAGRLELVGATAVGRYAALAAALAVTAAACLVAGLLIAVVQLLFGLPAAGSLALGAVTALAGWMFAGVAAVCAQLTESARTARGMASAVLGLAYLLRAAGDPAPRLSWLSWVSPLGWVERAQPYAGPRWWLLATCAAVAVLLAGAAAVLAGHRDLAAGLVPARPGQVDAAGWLRSPLALVWRLQRAGVAGWLAGFVVSAVVLGAAAKGIGATLTSSPQVRADIVRMGGHAGLVNAYLAIEFALLSVLAAAFGVAAVLRLRSDEAEHRAESMLAGPVSRMSWAAAEVVLAMSGIAVLMAVAGLGSGLGYGARTGSVGAEVARQLAAGLAQVPAAWVLAGVAVALFGLAPRVIVPAAWTALAVAGLLTLLGPSLRLPGWLLDLAPFTHEPRLPGGAFTATPLIWLTVVAAGLTAAGLIAFRCRDLS